MILKVILSIRFQQYQHISCLKIKKLYTRAEFAECYSFISYLVGMTGFEPATPYSRSKCTTKLCYIPLTTIILLPFLRFARGNQ